MKKSISGRTVPVPRPGHWSTSPRARRLATAAVLALLAAVLTGHAALVLLAAPALGALALMPRRCPPGELGVDVELSGTRCFEGEDVTVTATVRAPGGLLDEITLRLEPAPHVRSGAQPHTVLASGAASARWLVRPGQWGRYSPGAVLVSGRAGLGGWHASARVPLSTLDVFPRPARMRARLVPAE